MESRFDDLLHTIIVEKGQGIYGFFDTIMGFMYRRTDFFYEMAPGENMGFFPGQSESIIYNYFRKYQNLHYKERVPKRDIDKKEIEEFMKNHRGKVPANVNTNTQNLQGIPIEKIQNVSNLNNNINNTTKNTENQSNNLVQIPIKEVNNLDINETKKQKIIEEPIKIDDKYEDISTYNGDKCDNYNWSQGVLDVNIQIKLPEKITLKQVKKR
jgi:hypothetical protein